jgi:hypothetical protein
LVDSLYQRGVVGTDSHHFEVVLQVDELAHAFSDQVVVLGKHDAQSHVKSLIGAG